MSKQFPLEGRVMSVHPFIINSDGHGIADTPLDENAKIQVYGFPPSAYDNFNDFVDSCVYIRPLRGLVKTLFSKRGEKVISSYIASFISSSPPTDDFSALSEDVALCAPFRASEESVLGTKLPRRSELRRAFNHYFSNLFYVSYVNKKIVGVECNIPREGELVLVNGYSVGYRLDDVVDYYLDRIYGKMINYSTYEHFPKQDNNLLKFQPPLILFDENFDSEDISKSIARAGKTPIYIRRID